MSVFGQLASQSKPIVSSNLVLTSFIAFALGIIFRSIWIRGKNVYYEWKYSVGGVYLTRYDDYVWDQQGTEEPRKEKRTAPTVLTQTGESIKGKGDGIMLGQPKDWSLEGQIHSDGIISGFFYTNDPHHYSRGNFLLVPDETEDRLWGIWAGYDHTRNEVLSGEYNFQRVFNDFDVSWDVPQESLPSLVQIWCDQLGEEDQIESTLQRAIEGQDGSIICIADMDTTKNNFLGSLLALLRRWSPDRYMQSRIYDSLPGPEPESLIGRKALGFCLGKISEVDNLPDHVPGFGNDVPNLPRSIESATRVGFIGPVAVRENMQDRGIGTALIGKCIEKCKDEGITVLCASVSESEEEVTNDDENRYANMSNIDSIMHHYGFQQEYQGTTPNGQPYKLFLLYSLPE